MTFHDPLDVQAQERAQLEVEEQHRLQAQIEIDDLKRVVSNKSGRRFAFQILERAGVWRLSFDTNALSMAFKEGCRNEGLRLQAQIVTHCPERYAEMLRESRE
jgi:hypothetical protein